MYSSTQIADLDSSPPHGDYQAIKLEMTLVNNCTNGRLPEACWQSHQPAFTSKALHLVPSFCLGIGCSAFNFEIGHNLLAFVMRTVICGSKLQISSVH